MIGNWEPGEHQWIDRMTIDITEDGTGECEVAVSTVLLPTIDYSTGNLVMSLDPKNGTWETCLFWGSDRNEVVERYSGEREAELGHRCWIERPFAVRSAIKESFA
jgi:hypothetical protein